MEAKSLIARFRHPYGGLMAKKISETALLKLEEFSLTIIGKKEQIIRKWLERLPPWITPNRLSVSRIWLAFPTLIFILNKNFLTAFIFFIFAAALDLLDGPLARMRNSETELGKFLDIFADKTLIGLSLIGVYLIKSDVISTSLFSILIGADIIVVTLWLLGITMPVQKGRHKRLGANLWGRWKIFLQAIGLPLLFLGQNRIAHFFLWASVFFAVLSIVGHLTLREKKKALA